MSADPRHITIADRPNPDEDDCLSASAGLRGSLLLDLDLRLGLRDAHVSGCESVVGRAHPYAAAALLRGRVFAGRGGQKA